ncbi:hypothetical protein BSLG_005607 [Batrachochytrium salamandrivorans]|nr:hypothetical protein BSLG_005607 [Batrachochytrium salamandrivorans]
MSSTSPKLHHISQHLSVTHSVAPVPDMHSISDTQTVRQIQATTLTHDSAVVLPRLYQAVDKPYIKQTEATGTADKSLLMRDGSTVLSVRPPSSMLDDLLKRKHCEATDTDTTSGLSRGRPLEQRTRMRSMSVQLGNFRLGDMSLTIAKVEVQCIAFKIYGLANPILIVCKQSIGSAVRRASCDRYPSRKSEPDVSCPDQQLESQDYSLDQLPKIMSHTPKSSKYLLAPVIGTDNDSSIRQYSPAWRGDLARNFIAYSMDCKSSWHCNRVNTDSPMLCIIKTDKREPLVSYTNKSTLACEPAVSRTLAIASSDINPGSENTRSAETSMASHFPMNTKHHGSGEHSDCSNHPAINQQKYLQQTHARPNILPLGFQKCDSPLPNTTTQTEDANRKFPCNVCGKSFTRKYNLDAHLQSHNNIKPIYVLNALMHL